MKTRKKVFTKKAVAASEFKVSANDVFRRLDEKFEKFDQKFADQAQAALEARDEMRNEIRVLGEKIDAQIQTFSRELGKLNDNMARVMDQIADHEARLTQLEEAKKEEKIKAQTWDKARQLAWKAAQGGFWFLCLLGAAYGIKPLVKIFAFLGN